MRTFSYILLWILLSVLAAGVMYVLYTTLIVLAAILVNSPWRPYTWTTMTLGPLGKFLILVLGTIWLFLTNWFEHTLRDMRTVQAMLRYSGRAALVLLLVVGVSYLLILLSQTMQPA